MTSPKLVTVTWRGKPVRTPAGKILAAPQKLAETLQAEWDNRQGRATPPFTRLAASVIDIISDNRIRTEQAAAHFIDADVLCHFADSDAALIEYQHGLWDKWLGWIEGELQTPPATASGIRAARQSETYRAKAENILRQEDHWHFYALQNFITACRSFILGYGLYRQYLTADEAVALSDADALYQEQQWGADPETLQNRKNLCDDIKETQNYLLLLQD